MDQMESRQATSGMFMEGKTMGDISSFVDEFCKRFEEALKEKTSWGRNEVMNLVHTTVIRTLLSLESSKGLPHDKSDKEVRQ